MAQFELAIINDELGKLQVKDFEQVKGALIEVLDGLELPTLVDNNNYVEAKEKRAKLNKVAKLLDTQKTDMRKKALEIVAIAEKQIKELSAMANEKSASLDTLVKDYEVELEANRIKKANAIYLELQGLNSKNLSFEKVVEMVGDKWVNATTTEKMIKDDITSFYKKVDDDITMIKSAFPDYYQFIIDYYLTSFDMLQATKDGKQAWEIANKHVADGVPFSDKEIEENKTLMANEEKFVLVFTIKATRREIEQLQEYLNKKGIEVISAKKGK